MDLTKPSTPISNDINIQSLDIQKDNNTLKLDIKLKILISCTAVFCLLTIILLIISTSNTETINNTVTTVSPSNQDINHMLKNILNVSLMCIFNHQISTSLTQLILLMLKPTANNTEASIRSILWLI